MVLVTGTWTVNVWWHGITFPPNIYTTLSPLFHNRHTWSSPLLFLSLILSFAHTTASLQVWSSFKRQIRCVLIELVLIYWTGGSSHIHWQPLTGHIGAHRHTHTHTGPPPTFCVVVCVCVCVIDNPLWSPVTLINLGPLCLSKMTITLMKLEVIEGIHWSCSWDLKKKIISHAIQLFYSVFIHLFCSPSHQLSSLLF